MTDPKRLIDADDLGADLLAAARADHPSRHARGRAAAALGIGVGVAAMTAGGTAGAGASAGAGAGAGAGATAGATVAKVGGAGLLTKIIGGTLVVAAVGGGTAVAVRQSSRPAPPPVATVAPQLTPTVAPAAIKTTATTTAAPAPEEAPAVDVQALPSTPARPEGPTTSKPSQRASSNAPPQESMLTRELRSLDSAKALLEGHDPNGAIAALDRHDREFPNGSMRAESAMLRVEALLAKGDEAGAKARAKDLLGRDPSGPHAKRLRTILDR